MAGALNYDPAAKMSGPCSWPTKGCMDSSAFNYNPLATVSDPNATCILRAYGCTVSNTNLVSVYDASANAIAGGPSTGAGSCTLLIEGCMDATALNFNPQASVQATTVCIPNIPGCMTPAKPTGWPSGSTNPALPLGYMYGAGGATYNPAATFHDASTCGPTYVAGCMDPTAINYDSRATVTTTCYFTGATGCLNPLATNFNCTSFNSVAGSSSCAPSTRIARHFGAICNFGAVANNPFPPSPPAPSSDVATARDAVVTIADVTGSPNAMASAAATMVSDLKTAYSLGADETVSLTMKLQDSGLLWYIYFTFINDVPEYSTYLGGRRLQNTAANTSEPVRLEMSVLVEDANRGNALRGIISSDLSNAQSSHFMSAVNTADSTATLQRASVT